MSQGKRALLSVSSKAGIVDFAKALVGLGWKIVSSGGTAKTLVADGVPVTSVKDMVDGIYRERMNKIGIPPLLVDRMIANDVFCSGAMLDHRVVTLRPEVHGGLISDLGNQAHVQQLADFLIPVIDMMVCDFYHLSDAIAKPGATIESVIEATDIGGPAMVRSAAKGGRIVICRPQDRQPVIDELRTTGDVCVGNRHALAALAEFEVARYCMESARFLSNGEFEGIFGRKAVALPKGENGYQVPAALYADPDADNPFALQNYRVIDGAPLSYNNYTDIDRLHQTLALIANTWTRVGKSPHIAVGGKHGNPCGAAIGGDMREVVEKAATGNCLSMFGGTMMCNFSLDEELAHLMVSAGMNDGTQKFDSVIAPDFEPGAIEVFKRPKGKCRIVRGPIDLGLIPPINRKRFRQVEGGFLSQPDYNFVLNLGVGIEVWEHQYLTDLLLAWAIAWRSNSNTITIVKDGMLLGNGVGQQDRVGAAKLAVQRAREAGHGDKLEGSSAASDSYFPQPDAPGVLIDAGVKAIFTTSGSKNDKLTQALCTERGVKLIQLPDSEARGFFGH